MSKDMLKPGSGWSVAGSPPWSMVGDSILNAVGEGYLIWNEPLQDMEFEITYKLLTLGAGGGVQFRSGCRGSDSAPSCWGYPTVCGPFVRFCKGFPGILRDHCVGWLGDEQDSKKCQETVKVGEWATATAIMNGNQVSVWMNGVWCLDHTFTWENYLKGTLFGLQSLWDSTQYKSIKIRRLNIKGCMNPSYPNYNPEASSDSGCSMTNLRPNIQTSERKSFLKANDGVLSYSLPGSSKYSIRLVDVFGVVAKQFNVEGPVSNAKLLLPSPGIFFLELENQGKIARHKIINF